MGLTSPSRPGAAFVPGAVLAVDAGNSKTDVALVGPAGEILGTARGGGFCPPDVGVEPAVDVLAETVLRALAAAGLGPEGAADTRPTGAGTAGPETAGTAAARPGPQGPRPPQPPGPPQPPRPYVEHVSACLANADLPVEERQLRAAVHARGWGRTTEVANDTFAVLRAGVDEPRGVAVVCGAGINCVGMLPDGRTARFPAVGRISGDWGGGSGLAEEALWFAARAEDGRGEPTALAETLPAHFGLPSMYALIEALHLGQLPGQGKHRLTPVLFATAAEGDTVARSIVHRQAEEIVALAVVALRRLDLLGESVPLLLGGGVLAARHPLLHDRIAELLASRAPKATPQVVTAPPVLGAALLGLDHVGAPEQAYAHLRAQYAQDRQPV